MQIPVVCFTTQQNDKDERKVYFHMAELYITIEVSEDEINICVGDKYVLPPDLELVSMRTDDYLDFIDLLVDLIEISKEDNKNSFVETLQKVKYSLLDYLTDLENSRYLTRLCLAINTISKLGACND